ncbi:divalent metal cation transporter [Streptomyces coeruleorubidus]
MLFGSYRWAERIFLIMSLAFFAYPVAMILGHPDWGEVGRHLVVPHMEPSKDSILLAVALIGTVSSYMQFYAAAGVVDRGAKPADYRLIRAEAVLGAIFACVISLTIIIATATASAIDGTGPLDSAAQTAEALKPVAGHEAELLFALGLIGASALAGAVVLPPWPARWSRCRPATPSARPSVWSARSPAASATHRCSSACSPPRSCSAPRGR